MKSIASIVLLLLFASVSSLAQVTGSKGQSAPSKSTAAVSEMNWYRIDYALNEFENGKKTNVRTYTLQADETNRSCEVKVGSRVPILKSVGSSSSDVEYLELGVHIRCSLRSSTGGLGLYSSLYMASLAADSNYMKQGGVGVPILRQLQCDSNSAVKLGKVIVVASVDDPSSAGRKYVLEATVTKLNP